ncbi:long-chain-fatty-acid--CoA ligase [Pseudooceanicola sp. MF1-13]|uniref:long-chain-fatty-acid--CoA ligase n=1 Tax=Pseudooceanicola sp. MF1-13 TaxID=3379095 RepID=UPI0038924365
MFRFSDVLTKAARQWPDCPAVSWPDGSVTWAQLAARAGALADALAARGVKTGDRVAYLGFNGISGVETLFAAPLIGAAAVPLNYRLADGELIDMLNDCRPTAVIVDATHTDMLARLLPSCPSVKVVLSEAPLDGMEDLAQARDTATPADRRPSGGDEMLVIFYTGGTTGRSKGVMLSHTNIYSNAMGILANWDISEATPYAMTGPLFHSAAGARMYGAAFTGQHVVMQPNFDIEGLLRLIERHRIEIAQFVPTMIAMILDHPAFGRYDTSSLRMITYGAAPMPPALLARTMKAFPGVKFGQAFGMTEASPILTLLNPEDHDEPTSPRLHSVGRPVPFVDMVALGEDGTPLPPNEIGELAARGANIMLGYWDQPDLTAEVLKDGWYHTGDAGYMDEDGYFYVSGRIKDMIITGGENVYPIEVEQVLSHHPAVRAVAVIGSPDDKWGERVHAVLEPVPGQSVSADDLIAYCRDRLAHYKCPSRVTFWDGELPLTKVNKIDKVALRAAIAGK